jgi:hypothetical protein
MKKELTDLFKGSEISIALKFHLLAQRKLNLGHLVKLKSLKQLIIERLDLKKMVCSVQGFLDQ